MIVRGNYFDVQKYLGYQRKLLQYSEKTINRKWAHLRHLLNWANDVLLSNASGIEKPFPQYLLTARNDNQEKQLSPASMQRARLEPRNFFSWAKIHLASKYRPLRDDWIETIRPARSRGLQSELQEREYYALDEVRQLVDFSQKRLIDERDRAAAAFVFLSGMRVSAFVSLPVYCVDLENRSVDQLPSAGVVTKNSKAARTFLLPVKDLNLIIDSWHKKVEREIGRERFWYPSLSTDGMEWNLSKDIGLSDSRRMSFSRGLRRLCQQAGLKYKSPHKLRNGHGVYGVKSASTIEEFKAFSQNMMHENMEITDRLYGKLAADDIKKVVKHLGKSELGGSNPSELQEEDLLIIKDFMAWRRANADTPD